MGPTIEPHEIMSIDIVGGFGGNRSPKKFMHILVDHFTRYAWISTTRRQCARDYIKLVDPIAKKNKITMILADQYTTLNSEVLENYLDNFSKARANIVLKISNVSDILNTYVVKNNQFSYDFYFLASTPLKNSNIFKMIK